MKNRNIGTLVCWKGFFIPLFHHSILPILLMFIPLFSYSQESLKKNLFRLPLDTSLVLSGTFAEIRTNHFHSGIDISTNEAEGKDVMAAANGYVSRIKVAPDGSGQFVRVTKPTTNYSRQYTDMIIQKLRNVKFNPTADESVVNIQFNFRIKN